MEPFAQEKNAPGLDPIRQTQGAAPQTGALRPFTAVDLAPPAATGAPGLLNPAMSPFLENFSSPFKAPEAQPPIKSAPPADLPRPRSGFRVAEPASEDDYMPAAMPSKPATAPAGPPKPAAPGPSGTLPSADIPGARAPSRKPRFFLTSTAAVDGHPIETYLDVISAEVVLPKDLLFRNPAPYGELHRLKAAEDQLQKVKAKALEELGEKAKQLQADGVVGVQVSFVNLDTVCCLCSAVGTAVRI